MKTYSEGMTFGEAVSKMSDTERITFGTRTEKWHILYKGDMDFNYSPTKKQAIAWGEAMTLAKVMSPMMLNN